MNEKIIISVKDLVKDYGTFHAVKSISFDVFEGEIFGLLGPNGAGKSTTLEIIETLRQKTSGKIDARGYQAVLAQISLCGVQVRKGFRQRSSGDRRPGEVGRRRGYVQGTESPRG